MRLSELGEFGLIRRFAPHFEKGVAPGTVGIGDDCAVIPQGDERLLVTTDLLVEDVHFLRRGIRARDLGYKSLAVNLSDIAAMGAVPESAFLSLALPKDTDVAWIDAFFEGIAELAETSGTALLGGDTTGSRQGVIINIAVMGRARPEHIKLRGDARPGDIICLTGPTGESGAGLKVLLENRPAGELESRLIEAHNRPRPHLEEGLFLGGQHAVHAMMDVSDGVDSDLRHILRASNVGASVNLEQVPISKMLAKASEQLGFHALELALAAGEDYCLLATIDAQAFSEIDAAFAQQFGHGLAAIGRITEKANDFHYLRDGKSVSLADHGFDHFAKS